HMNSNFSSLRYLRVLCLSAVNSALQVFIAREKLVVVAFAVLLMCSVARSQPGTPGPSSPLYGARPDAGAVSTGLPTALRDVRIEQKLNQQLPLDLTFR